MFEVELDPIHKVDEHAQDHLQGGWVVNELTQAFRKGNSLVVLQPSDLPLSQLLLTAGVRLHDYADKERNDLHTCVRRPSHFVCGEEGTCLAVRFERPENFLKEAAAFEANEDDQDSEQAVFPLNDCANEHEWYE